MSATPVTTLSDHPNRDEVVGVLARMVQLDDPQLCALALAWRDDDITSAARSRALEPDSPLVLEALAAFDSLSFLYADDLGGEADYLTVPAPVIALALKAVRDAIAAAFARPVLSRAEHRALLRPWRRVFSDDSTPIPDFGPQHDAVLDMLGLLSSLACRSHDVEAERRWSSVLVHGGRVDLDQHGDAIDLAWDAAVSTQRRRMWGLLSRHGQEAFYRRCAACDRSSAEEDGAVLALCLGAVMGVLMGDVLDADVRALLVAPVAAIVPRQTEGIGH